MKSLVLGVKLFMTALLISIVVLAVSGYGWWAAGLYALGSVLNTISWHAFTRSGAYDELLKTSDLPQIAVGCITFVVFILLWPFSLLWALRG